MSLLPTAERVLNDPCPSRLDLHPSRGGTGALSAQRAWRLNDTRRWEGREGWQIAPRSWRRAALAGRTLIRPSCFSDARRHIVGMPNDTVVVRPRKSDISVDSLGLVWVPHWRDANGSLESAEV
jgi:hypothetical protein